MRDRSLPTSADTFLSDPPSTWMWPAGLGSLGARSYLEPPYTIRSPHRVHIGDDVRIGARAVLSVVEEFMGDRFQSEMRIGDGCEIGRDAFITCAVVARDVPARTVVFGNPARAVRHWDEEQGAWVAGPSRRDA